MSVEIEDVLHRPTLGHPQFVKITPATDDGKITTVADVDNRTNLGRLACPQLRQYSILRQNTLDQEFHLPAGFFFSIQARRYYLCVVENNDITRLQQIGEFDETAVLDRPVLSIQHQ